MSKSDIAIITLTEGSEKRQRFFPELRKSLQSQQGVNVHWYISAPDEKSFQSIVGNSNLPAFFLQYRPGDGLGKRRNDLMGYINEQFVMNLDDDDYLLHENALENAIQDLQDHPESGLSMGRILTKTKENTFKTWNETKVRGKKSHQLSPGEYSRDYLIEKIYKEGFIPLCSGAAIYRRSERLLWSEDVDVFEDVYALLSGMGEKFFMSDDVRYVYRMHGEGTMINQDKEKIERDLYTVLDRF